MARNPALITQLNALRGDQKLWRDVKQRLLDDMAVVGVYNRFINALINSGYDEAVETLPVDNPKTTKDESMSPDEAIRNIEDMFNKPIEDVTLEEAKAALVKAYGKVLEAQDHVDTLTSEIQDFEMLQKNDGNKI